jgi:hypothetical protein
MPGNPMEKPVKNQAMRAGWLVSSPYNVYAWFMNQSEAEEYCKKLDEKGAQVLPSRMVYEEVWDKGYSTEFDGCIHNWETVWKFQAMFGNTLLQQCSECRKIRLTQE